ncbi:PSD1 and planctomycete cytochrome C domain-containing protein [Akkermansiaceae bacterium]|nr:PSD1 and planctomycete cytochrome C domain-containing protein [Akkermansiaceae bacterium]MDB4537622.1 PSD1 and planctomycete cytochrome C domain-containing protein [Akkermansiaceae bacterium]
MILASSASGESTLSFNKDIRPILSDKCFACHGFDEETREAKLRLDTPEGAYKEKKRGRSAIVPGKPDESEAWLRIIAKDEDDVMPPPDSHKQLSSEEKLIIRQWIAEDAEYQNHWAFEAPVKAQVPAGEGAEIDRFVGADLQRDGLEFSPEADRSTLIRRVSFTLTGLPPSVEEVEAYLNDQSPDAYAGMVDRYLASKHYGEEMARHWLDAARYGDTHGMHLDNERQMWAYRDWVIESFNKNLPYDEFTIQQLAGDLMPNPTQEQMVATGFNRCNVTTGEGGSIAKEFIFRYAVDRASTTAQVWLGLTAGCAVCHDHKYDPITSKDFYSLYAFFNSNADPAMDGNKLLTQPVIKVKTPDYDQKMTGFAERERALEKKMGEISANLKYEDPAEKDPRPPRSVHEQVWFDDAFPKGAEVGSSGHPLTFVDSPVKSGKKSLKRSGPAMAQDYYQAGAEPLLVPSNANFFLNVYLDPNDPPEEVMIQFHTKGWSHRALWGDDIIDFGKKGTTERYRAGDIPKNGEWVRLEVPGEKMGLAIGDKVVGFAFTVHGGTAYFDRFGVEGITDPASDPSLSLMAWRKSRTGKDTPEAKGKLRGWLKEGPDKPRKPEELAQIKSYYLQNVCQSTRDAFTAVRGDLEKVGKEKADFDAGVPSTFVFKDLPKPRESFVMIRGEYDKPGEKVEPNTPLVLPPLKKGEERANRLDLAKWLVAPENPLTARVAVNRFWQQVFGVGLVKTSHDFGTQGALPSHPELLDFLALRFQEKGWDVKALMRELVMSRTFRQQSRAASPRWVQDPANRKLARGPRLRLAAEQLRDQALFVSGLIDLKMGGKGVSPYQPPNIWEPVAFGGSNTRYYKQGTGSDLYRRSVYTFFKRTAPHPAMTNFDAPAREQTCLVRETSNTPLQALQLLNDVQHFEAARGLASRMMQSSPDLDARINFAFKSVLSRAPSADEKAITTKLYQRQLARYQQAPEDASKAIGFGESKAPADLDVPQFAAFTLVANLILNMDEAIVRN